jgi:hypothetical protein
VPYTLRCDGSLRVNDSLRCGAAVLNRWVEKIRISAVHDLTTSQYSTYNFISERVNLPFTTARTLPAGWAFHDHYCTLPPLVSRLYKVSSVDC